MTVLGSCCKSPYALALTIVTLDLEGSRSAFTPRWGQLVSLCTLPTPVPPFISSALQTDPTLGKGHGLLCAFNRHKLSVSFCQGLILSTT